ncbi:protein kinase domain-containing protein [Lusitaniella coriacea]|uniref:protein kinase domain-containing protein n=1 Tax=Lusitaniella coriacea TaxID=1983105 RepID=UPI003CE8AF17
MLSPINPGTLLNQRYRVVRILGQQDFGQTYLAQDEGRFNELCTLKEMAFPDVSEDILVKSRERFQQEASQLYRLENRQIPQFRATFEENGRLFLVRDYIKGKTLRELLGLRQSKDEVFSEVEVRQLLEQLLPVLDYLHRQGIVHGNLTPDNILLRVHSQIPGEQGGQEPILIGFEVMDELVRGLGSGSSIANPFGYKPPEQIQTGKTNSTGDLYSLAATMVTLLTGKPFQELYDSAGGRWLWAQQVRVSPELKSILQRMLSEQPRDRYPSVWEVQQALEAPPNPTQPSNVEGNQTPTPPPQQPDSPIQNASQMATLAVGGKPEPSRSQTPRKTSPDPVIPPPRSDSLLDNPLALVGFTLLLIAVAGGGSWGLVRLLQQSGEPETQPSVVISPVETPSPTPTPSPALSPTTETLTLLPGRPFVRQGTLEENALTDYTFVAQSNQQLQMAIASEGVWAKLFKPNGEFIDENAKLTQSWDGILPESGDYRIQLFSIPGSPARDRAYQLSLQLNNPVEAIPSPSASPSPTASPTPPEPQFDRESISFPANQESLEIAGQTEPERIKRLAIAIADNQVLEVEVLEGRVSLDIRYPDERLIDDAEGVQLWQGQIVDRGEYLIDVTTDRPRDFKLLVSVRNLEQPLPVESP